MIAGAHDINTNQLFKWRRQYRKGELEVVSASKLLPVKVVPEPAPTKPVRGRPPKPKRLGVIHIDLGHARVRIETDAHVHPQASLLFLQDGLYSRSEG